MSTHAIDHFMVRREDPKTVCTTLTLHKEVVREAGLEDWSLHMDHNPIEVTMEIGREWQEEAEEGRTNFEKGGYGQNQGAHARAENMEG